MADDQEARLWEQIKWRCRQLGYGELDVRLMVKDGKPHTAKVQQVYETLTGKEQHGRSTPGDEHG